MNKKLNTVLFVLLATLGNMIIMVILFLLCVILISRFADPESQFMPLFLGLTFLVSIGGTFYLYTVIMKKITATYAIEKYLDPIFKKRKSRRPPEQGMK